MPTREELYQQYLTEIRGVETKPSRDQLYQQYLSEQKKAQDFTAMKEIVPEIPTPLLTDIESGIPASQRAQLSYAETPEEQESFLRSLYPEGVERLPDEAGYIVLKEGVPTLVNPKGLDLGDIAALERTAVETTIPMSAGIAGTIAGGPAGGLAAGAAGDVAATAAVEARRRGIKGMRKKGLGELGIEAGTSALIGAVAPVIAGKVLKTAGRAIKGVIKEAGLPFGIVGKQRAKDLAKTEEVFTEAIQNAGAKPGGQAAKDLVEKQNKYIADIYDTAGKEMEETLGKAYGVVGDARVAPVNNVTSTINDLVESPYISDSSKMHLANLRDSLLDPDTGKALVDLKTLQEELLSKAGKAGYAGGKFGKLPMAEGKRIAKKIHSAAKADLDALANMSEFGAAGKTLKIAREGYARRMAQAREADNEILKFARKALLGKRGQQLSNALLKGKWDPTEVKSMMEVFERTAPAEAATLRASVLDTLLKGTKGGAGVLSPTKMSKNIRKYSAQIDSLFPSNHKAQDLLKEWTRASKAADILAEQKPLYSLPKIPGIGTLFAKLSLADDALHGIAKEFGFEKSAATILADPEMTEAAIKLARWQRLGKSAEAINMQAERLRQLLSAAQDVQYENETELE